MADEMSGAVAIIGIGCRLPGADGPQALWRLLQGGIDAVSEVPADRFDIERFYSADPESSRSIATRRGGFIDGIDLFEPEFFGVSPREAGWMDPQQRLLLECAWQAFEDAGLRGEELAGSATGTFVGQDSGNYWDLVRTRPDLSLYGGTGSAFRGVLSGRLSYVFDLRGPSVSVDTVCSSSLTAVHMACRSLREAECSLAIAAGVKVNLSPADSILFSQGGALAPDGRCKFGDAAADGFVRGEGAGVVVLRPLRDALARGDRIYAVVAGSAVNNDGHDGGSMVAPAVAGQERVLRAAYADAAICPGDVDYVEAHGTGTRVGDPVELRALTTVLREGRPADRVCLVGSVKTNIGHLEAAAGIAGLIKAAMCLRHRTVPPSLHHHRANPDVPWHEVPLVVPTRSETLSDHGRPLVAGVTSVGMSGANAHVVLVEAPHPDQSTAQNDVLLLPLSAHHPEVLRKLAQSYATFLTDEGDGAGDLRDLCHTAAVRRRHHSYRLAVTGRTPQELADELEATGCDTGSRLDGPPAEADGCPRIAFVFASHGAQWPGMCQELLRTSPVFRTAVQRCDEAIREETGWSVMDRLASAAQPDIDEVQPMLWAVQVGLASLWRSWGIEPDVVVGHSMGEVAAAHTAGVLGLADAAAVICRRSRLLRRVKGRGAMLWVELSGTDAEDLVADFVGRATVAAYNGPTSTVLSGDTAALDEIRLLLSERKVQCRPVRVDVASHGHHVDGLLGELRADLRDIVTQRAAVPMHSTVTGRKVEGPELGAEYWADNLREPVRFTSALRGMPESGRTVFIEISPHPVLVPEIKESLHVLGRGGAALPSLRRGEDGLGPVLRSLGAVYERGHPVDWTALYPAGRVVTLPPYIWQRQRYWLGVSEEPVPAVAGVSSTPLTDITAPEVDDGNGLARLPADERRRRLLTLARHHIAAELVLPVGKVALGRPLADLGLDSLMATAVRRRLESVLGVELPATLLWNCPTLDALAVHLNDLLDGDGSALAEQGEAQRGSGGVLALLTALESEES